VNGLLDFALVYTLVALISKGCHRLKLSTIVVTYCIGGGSGHGGFSKGRARATIRRAPARRGGEKALPFENAP
jgi:hypothetical protein